MAKKTYRTYSLKGLTILTHDEKGDRIEIVFHGGIQIDSTAKFSTSDKKLQDIIENASGFNRDYYIESVVEDAPKEEPKKEKVVAASPEPEKPLVDVKDIKRFRNLVEMKDALKEVGIAVEDSWNYSQAKKAALENGYDYRISKAEN